MVLSGPDKEGQKTFNPTIFKGWVAPLPYIFGGHEHTQRPLQGKGRVRTQLLIHNCIVKDRDWQSWLAGETILGEKFNQLRAVTGCRQAGPL